MDTILSTVHCQIIHVDCLPGIIMLADQKDHLAIICMHVWLTPGINITLPWCVSGSKFKTGCIWLLYSLALENNKLLPSKYATHQVVNSKHPYVHYLW